jgi:hypothetical protein
MNKGQGTVRVTTEVAYCSFCGRPRTLRREERQLGELVRTNVTCESCHRTLFSSTEIAATRAEASTPAAAAEEPAAEAPAPAPKTVKPNAAEPKTQKDAAKTKTSARSATKR